MGSFYSVLNNDVLKYLSPVSGATTTTLLPSPSSLATFMATKTAAQMKLQRECPHS